MKTLVAYFSASGVTGRLAESLAEVADADLFEIVPVKPYTDADLKWTNPLARCNKEKIGKKAVPVAGRVANMEQYDLVLIGFPIWYYAAPNIIETFVRSYDFTGITIALFATSGGSDIARAATKLQPLVDGEIIGARLFQPYESKDVLRQWFARLSV